VIVADVLLAGEATGIDLCFAAIERRPEIAMVLISADSVNNFQSYPLRAVCLRKPFNASDLLGAITRSWMAVS
jgi:hypothetical protein